MQTTFIVKNLTEETLSDLAAMEPRAAHDQLMKWAFGDLRHCVTVKHGSGAFRDRVDWNSLYKRNAPMTHKIEPRKGYKLFTFAMS
jgi:hypothetical protein